MHVSCSQQCSIAQKLNDIILWLVMLIFHVLLTNGKYVSIKMGA